MLCPYTYTCTFLTGAIKAYELLHAVDLLNCWGPHDGKSYLINPTKFIHVHRHAQTLTQIHMRTSKHTSSSSSFPLAPTGAQAAYKSSPSILILGQPLKLSPAIVRPLCFSLQIVVPSVSWAALLSLSLWVPRQGLTCDTSHWFSDGVSNLSPASLKAFIFYWLFLGPFPEFSVADGLRPLDPKDSSKAGVDECVDLLQCRSRGSLCFSSIQHDRFYCAV